MNHIQRRVCSLLTKFAGRFSTQVQPAQSKTVARREYLQFNKNRLTDFGELPHGEIPAALKVCRPTQVAKLSNGVRVAAERWNSTLASITVTVKAGTRQQDLDNSSVSSFVSRLVLKGTSNRSKAQIEQEIDSFGGTWTSQVGRQTTTYTLTFAKQQLQSAVNFLGDILNNSLFNSEQVEAEKSSIKKDASSISDPKRVSIENAHFTSFRDHYLGQPSHGIRENIYNITSEQVKQYHSQFYVGDNIVVSGAGNIEFAKFNELVNNAFGKLPKSAPGIVKHQEKPYFTPSLMYLRDDEISNVSTAISFVAPGWHDPDYFAFEYFRRLLGNYKVTEGPSAHLNTGSNQYNGYQGFLSSFPDILAQESYYFPYSDVGLFGNFLYGNEIFARTLLFSSQWILSQYAQDVNQVEVFRARNKYWNELLQRNSSHHVSKENAAQVAYLDRIVSRTEVATRISNIDVSHIQRVATKWFWDKQISIVAWGPIHHVMSGAVYNRTFRRSTLGSYGNNFVEIA